MCEDVEEHYLRDTVITFTVSSYRNAGSNISCPYCCDRLGYTKETTPYVYTGNGNKPIMQISGYKAGEYFYEITKADSVCHVYGIDEYSYGIKFSLATYSAIENLANEESFELLQVKWIHFNGGYMNSSGKVIISEPNGVRCSEDKDCISLVAVKLKEN